MRNRAIVVTPLIIPKISRARRPAPRMKAPMDSFFRGVFQLVLAGGVAALRRRLLATTNTPFWRRYDDGRDDGVTSV